MRTTLLIPAVVAALLVTGALMLVAVRDTDRSGPSSSGSAGQWPTSTVPHDRHHLPVVLFGWSVRGALTSTGVVVFDDARKAYRPVGVPGGVASPDGRFVVALQPGQLRLYVVASGRDMALNLPAGNVGTVPVWSYDSGRFAYISGDTAVIVEATGTLTARSGPLPFIAKCDLKWSVDGSELRVLQTVRSDPPLVLDPDTGAVTARVPHCDDHDPCPGHRGYVVTVSEIPPPVGSQIDDVELWGCVTPHGFQIRLRNGTTVAGKDIRSGFHDMPVEMNDQARFTLYRWAGCAAHERCLRRRAGWWRPLKSAGSGFEALAAYHACGGAPGYHRRDGRIAGQPRRVAA